MTLQFKDFVGIATGVAALLASAFAAIRYFIKKEQLEVDNQRQQERCKELETRCRDLKQAFEDGAQRQLEKYMELDANYQELKLELDAAARAGGAALALKAEMDALLGQGTRRLQARASSILVPVPGGNATELVFLCALGPPEIARTVRRTTVPIHQGIAGYVFQHGEPYLAIDARSDKTFFKGIDRISSYTTKDILCVPIRRDKTILGVMQFLNKVQGAFNEQDLENAHRFASQLSACVARFLEDERNFELLGGSQTEQMTDGTILFCDLTASSMLLDSMNFAAAIKRINAYVEMSCDIALRRGGTVDKILGDGAMLRFNVPRRLPDSRLEAVRAAIEMRDAFERQKALWRSDGIPVDALFTRIGLASGPMRQAVLGPSQFQSLTVVGRPVILASNLCAGAPRDRSVVLATAASVEDLGHSVTSTPVDESLLGKIKGEQTSVVELLACVSNLRESSAMSLY